VGKKAKGNGQKSAFEQAQERASSGGKMARGKAGLPAKGRGAAASTGDAEMDALLAELTAGMSTEELAQMDEMLAQLGDMDMGDMESMMAEAMTGFEQMANLDPEELAKELEEAMMTPEVQEVSPSEAKRKAKRKEQASAPTTHFSCVGGAGGKSGRADSSCECERSEAQSEA
jgi:hypothetical protein